MKFIKITLIIILFIIILYIFIFPIRYLIIDFGIENILDSFYGLVQITFTDKQYFLVEEKQIEGKKSFKYIINPYEYIKTIEKIMKTHNFVPDDIGMLGERIPYNNIDTNEKISILQGLTKFYGILEFEKDI